MSHISIALPAYLYLRLIYKPIFLQPNLRNSFKKATHTGSVLVELNLSPSISAI